MSASGLLVRVLAVALAQAALSTALVAFLTLALDVALEIVNAALLSLSTSVLGNVWALRQRLVGARRGNPSLSAALVPLVACALFIAPRLATGPREPALAILAALAMVAPLTFRAWSEWIVRDRADGSVLAVVAPLLGVGLAAAIVAPAALPVGLLLVLAFGTVLTLRRRRRARDAAALASWASRVDVRAETPIDEPSVRDPALRQVAADLRLRIQQLALETGEDERALEQIADAGGLRTRFMAAMSHELKSPLNSILGFGQLLEGGVDGALTSGQHESVVMIREAAEELLLLLTDILDLARLEAGKLALHRQWTPSVEILTEAIEKARTFVEGQDVHIEAELQPGLPPVHVDKLRIVQAVVGLFRNAAPSLVKTTIRLRARVASGPPGPARHLRIEIHDALGAISREHLERIFDAFQEVSALENRRVGGLGMALSLSRGLVRMHGGEVWADRSPGAGTVLCVAIPLDRP